MRSCSIRVVDQGCLCVSPSTGDGEYTEVELAHDHPRYEGIRNAVTGFARTCYLERETPGAEASGLGGAVSVSEAVPRKERCHNLDNLAFSFADPARVAAKLLRFVIFIVALWVGGVGFSNSIGERRKASCDQHLHHH